MPYTEVDDDQFEWSGSTVIHKPTGAAFTWSYPNSQSTDLSVNWKFAGDVLPNGDDYDRNEILHAAVALLEEKYPRTK